MKSRLIALSVVMSLTINQTALAATMGGDSFDDNAAAAAVSGVESKTAESVKQLDQLITSIKELQATNEKNGDDKYVKAANIIVSSLSMATFIAHIRGEKSLETSLSLVTSSVTSVLSTALDYYQSGKRVSLEQVGEALIKHQEVIANLAGLNQQQQVAASQLVTDLADINKNLQFTAGRLQQQISEGRRDVVVVTVLSLGIVYLARFVPNSIKKQIADDATQAEIKLAKGSKASAFRLNQATGASSVADLLQFAAGFASESSQAQMQKVLFDLNTAKTKMKTILSQ